MVDLPDNEILGDIAAQLAESRTPPELQATLTQAAKDNAARLQAFRMYSVAMAAGLLSEMEAAGTDKDTATRIAATALMANAAFLIGAMKARQGERFEPGRFAIVAWAVARDVGEAALWRATHEGVSALAAAEAEADPFTMAKVVEEMLGRVRGDTETCIACAKPMEPGQAYFPDVSGGYLHAACTGPEREGFVKDVGTGEPLGPGDPIPTPQIWTEG